MFERGFEKRLTDLIGIFAAVLVFDMVKNYVADCNRMPIYNKIHHGLNQFYSILTLQDV